MTVVDQNWLRHNLGAGYKPQAKVEGRLLAERKGDDVGIRSADQNLQRQIIDFDGSSQKRV